MAITAEVICDSVGPAGIRLTTLQLRYPRFIHSELMTHRAFSRNARSSRAVPVVRLIEEVEADPVIPIEWGENCKGMQARKELDPENADFARKTWLMARDYAVAGAKRMLRAKAHKQVVNRLLEPFAHIDVLVTATDWRNFFGLRIHPDAQPEMQQLADEMHRAIESSEPRSIGHGDWHLPYACGDETFAELIRTPEYRAISRPYSAAPLLARVSAARCRRISYRPWDSSDASVEADLVRFQEMVNARPLHASPMEHQAMATGDPRVRSGNFRGWVQFRQTIRDHDVSEG